MDEHDEARLGALLRGGAAAAEFRELLAAVEGFAVGTTRAVRAEVGAEAASPVAERFAAALRAAADRVEAEVRGW